MKVGLITTLNTNIGDDFIRTGVKKVLDDTLSKPVEYVAVNKHNVSSAYPRGHVLRSFLGIRHKYLRVALMETASFLFSKRGGSLFDDCDLIVQCGTPVFFNAAWRTEWSFSLWHHIIGRLSNRIPVLNLGAGGCYPGKDVESISVRGLDRYFLRFILSICDRTTVRDPLAKAVAASLGFECSLLPCPALLCAWPKKPSVKEGKYIFVNYMLAAGHYGRREHTCSDRWERVVKTFIETMRDRYPLAFICHSEEEKDLASRMAPDIPCFFPRTVEAYLFIMRQGIAGLFNRMHACVCAASLGIPSIGVGVDSRMRMVREIGLPCFHAEEVDAAVLVDMVEKVVRNREIQRDQLFNLRKETFERYQRVIRENI